MRAWPLFLFLSIMPALKTNAEMPPILDRQLFFGEVEISGAQISPDGQWISFLKPYKGTRNIWVKKTGEPFSNAKPVSAESPRPISDYFWSRDGKFLLYAQDKGGDENFNVYAIDPQAAVESSTGVPPTRNLTNAQGVRAMIYAVPRTKPDVLLIGLNDRDQAWHDLYELTISTGQKKLLRKNTDQIADWVFDHTGALRLALRTTPAGDTEVLRVDTDGFKPIYSCTVLESCGTLQFDSENKQIYLTSNKGNHDLADLELLDPNTGATSTVESDPNRRVDFGDALFSDVDDRLLATNYEDDRVRWYWKDHTFETDYQWLLGKLQGKEIRFGSHSKDEQVWIVSAFSDREPGETYVFDRRAKTLTLQYRIRPEIPRDALSEMKSIRYPSSDGLEIPAYLTLPKGIPAKSLPLIVFPHGGPWARDSWGYSTFPQFLANRGYAVLQPNFRGSTGFGKQFLNAGNGEWGRKMQDDLTWGVKYLVSEGIIDPKRVGVAGGSYGGYATLAGVAFTPELYAGAVSIVGPSNLITLLNSIPPYWEAGRKQMYTRMADPTTPAGKALLEAESPLNSANKIRCPLMVVQGKNDPRVNKRESDQIVAAVRDRGQAVEYLVAPDEGHGFRRPINNLAMVAAMEKFLAAHLKGRYQEQVPADVEKRLTEITVDPKTVVLEKK